VLPAVLIPPIVEYVVAVAGLIQKLRVNGAAFAFGTSKRSVVPPPKRAAALQLLLVTPSQTLEAYVTVPVLVTAPAADPALSVILLCMES